MAREATRLRIVTYNVHRCRGLDRRTKVGRVADVLRATDADVVALQEVLGPGPASGGQLEELGARLGMGWVLAPTRHLRGRAYGNAVLSRFPIVRHAQYDLTWQTCEPRCCLRADVQVGPRVLHVYNVHLGTAMRERRHQAGRLATFVHDRRTRGPKVVLGDFNEWLRGEATRILSATLDGVDLPGSLRRRRTYPGVMPLLHLDHIYVAGGIEVGHVGLVRTRTALVASDHVPLVAEIRLQD